MLKRLHKIFLFVCLICCLALNPIVVAQNPTNNIQTGQEVNFANSDINVKDLDIEPLNTQKVKQSVVPDTNKEGKKVIGLFLKVMAGVAFSAIILYVILVFVKRFYGSAFIEGDADSYESFNLATPNSKQEALNSFLNRTK